VSALIGEHRFSIENNAMNYRKPLRLAFGIFFIALGFAGLFLPILQGILFIIIGLLLIAPYSKTIRRWITLFETRHPHLYERAQSAMNMFRRKRG